MVCQKCLTGYSSTQVGKLCPTPGCGAIVEPDDFFALVERAAEASDLGIARQVLRVKLDAALKPGEASLAEEPAAT